MNCFSHLRSWTLTAAAGLLVAAAMPIFSAAQTQIPIEIQAPDSAQESAHGKPLPLKPDLPAMATNHRLILKDGSYQMVRTYEIVGDRVRYISTERGGEWEEIPADLVDWDATRKWERDHANQAADEASPAMKEAREIDKQEKAERDEAKARRPEVAKGLELPDEDSVFVLDTFRGTPELAELLPTELNMNTRTKHGIGTLNPLAGSKASLELEGAHAKVHLHVNDPAIYLSLAARDDAEQVVSHALTVETGNAKDVANRKHGARSPQSGFAIVRVDERRALRIVGAIHMSVSGAVTQDENVIPTKVEVLYDKHWLKITPVQPLAIGEYALIEILSPSDINQSVWDFRVDPSLGDNPGAIGPIQKP
jgi:flagellar motor protein MotB